MQRITYRADLKQHGRDLRKNGTLGEVLLWQQLRTRQMRGYRFNRQKPLGNFIADFYCHKLGLVIEIDGSSHTHERAQEHDFIREKKLNKLGLSVLRFGETEVKNQMEDILERIDAWIIQKERNGVLVSGKIPLNPPLKRGT